MRHHTFVRGKSKAEGWPEDGVNSKENARQNSGALSKGKRQIQVPGINKNLLRDLQFRFLNGSDRRLFVFLSLRVHEIGKLQL